MYPNKVLKTFTSMWISEEEIGPLTDLVSKTVGKVKNTGKIHRLELYKAGVVQDLVFGDLYIVPSSVCGKAEDFPTILLRANIYECLSREDAVDFEMQFLRASDKVGKDTLKAAKDKIFTNAKGEVVPIIVFVPAWHESMEFDSFLYDQDMLRTQLERLVFSAAPANKGLCDTLMKIKAQDPGIGLSIRVLPENENIFKTTAVADMVPNPAYPQFAAEKLPDSVKLAAFVFGGKVEKKVEARPKVRVVAAEIPKIDPEVISDEELKLFNNLEEQVGAKINEEVRHEVEVDRDKGVAAAATVVEPKVAALTETEEDELLDLKEAVENVEDELKEAHAALNLYPRGTEDYEEQQKDIKGLERELSSLNAKMTKLEKRKKATVVQAKVASAPEPQIAATELIAGKRKLIKREGDVKIYRDAEFDEYVVVPAGGSEEGTYYTNDKQDAFDTAVTMAKTAAPVTAAAIDYFGDKVLREMYPEMDQQLFPLQQTEFNAPIIQTQQDSGNVSNSPNGVGLRPTIQEEGTNPLRREPALRGPGFSADFYRTHDDLDPAFLVAASADKTAAISPDDVGYVLGLLKRVAGDLAAYMVAGFEVTKKPLFTDAPGEYEVRLEEYLSSKAGIQLVNGPVGSQPKPDFKLKEIFANVADNELVEIVNKTWAQAAVWAEEEEPFVYEVYVRLETINKDTLTATFKYVISSR